MLPAFSSSRGPTCWPHSRGERPLSAFDLIRFGERWRAAFTSMGSPCELLVETPDAALARRISVFAQNESRRIDRKFSGDSVNSVVHALNPGRGRPRRVDGETARLIEHGAALWKLSEGRFDLTSGMKVGWQHVGWESPVLTLPAGMEIVFNGISREYAVDRVAEFAAFETECPVLVNFGGDLCCTGRLPRAGAWQVGIDSIEKPGETSRFVELKSGALATRGDARRHIFDARTGSPVANAPRSITVAAPTCSQAGRYSTLAMLQGARAEAFLDAEGARYWSLR